MAYRYNDKTGEFEKVTDSAPQGSYTQPRPVTPPSSTHDSTRPQGSNSRGNTDKGGCLASVLTFLAYTILPYLILAGLVSMCN